MPTYLRFPFRFGLLVAAILLSAQAAIPQSIFDINFGGARSHPFDVQHIAVDVRFNLERQEVSGTVKHRIRSLGNPLTQLRVDAAANMNFTAVAVDGSPAQYQHSGDTLTVMLPTPRSYNDTFTLSISYNVIPKKGLYFITPNAGVRGQRHQIWTQGEAEDNRYWLPCYDYPNDRATSEVRATIPAGWKLLSNGLLRSTTPNPDSTTTWHWSQTKDHASYLIMLAAGDYLVTRDTADGIPLEYWSYPDMPERVAPTFARTPDVMRYLASKLGVPYPWEKYAQVMIANFMYGGMENTTATTLNDYALVDERGLIDYNPDELIAHEAAHQWFGDLVTNRSWGHLWIHESYATYLAARFCGHYYGDDVFAKEMYDAGTTAEGTDSWGGRNPIANGKGTTANIYQRGARVLQMLCQLVGEDQFWRANQFFLQRHAHGLVESNDLKLAFEDATGLNLDWFFQQWMYGAGMPQLAVEKTWEEGQLQLIVRQTQTMDSLTGVFRAPVPIEFHLADRVVADTVWVAHAADTFRFPLPAQPKFVIFDAGDVLLKTVQFPRTTDELIAQLQAPRMIDRLLAVKELSRMKPAKKNAEQRARAIAEQFRREPSPFVRREMVSRVGTMEETIAATMLPQAIGDPDADVRKEAVENAWIIPKEERTALLRPLLRDSSFSVINATLGVLATTDTAGLEPYLIEMQGKEGRRGRLAQGWLNAVTAGKFTRFVDAVAQYTTEEFSNHTRADAYQALSALDTTTSNARTAILRGIVDESDRVRNAAATAAARHLDDALRTALQTLQNSTTEGIKEVIEKVLEGDWEGDAVE